MNEELQEGARASTLDLPRGELEELAQVFCRMAVEYFAAEEWPPVFPDTSAEKVAELFRAPMPEEGVGLEALARSCGEVVKQSRQNGHPRIVRVDGSRDARHLLLPLRERRGAARA